MIQTCKHCGDNFRGRVDKKFCTSHCRSTFYNKNKEKITRPFKQVNQVLKRNYFILNKLTSQRKRVKTNKETLLKEGFNFDYFTNVLSAKNGKTYYFCYDRGYLPITSQTYSIVVKKEFA